MSKTDDNLKAAVEMANEACTKYLIDSRRAEKQSIPEVAWVFKAAALSESFEVANYLAAMYLIKNPHVAINEAVESQKRAHTKVYPAFAQEADEEKLTRIARLFERGLKLAQAREQHLLDVFHTVYAGTRRPKPGEKRQTVKKDYFVCTICGNIATDNIPEKCDICGAAGNQFVQAA